MNFFSEFFLKLTEMSKTNLELFSFFSQLQLAGRHTGYRMK